MSVKRLTTNSFRNLENGNVNFHANLNFIVGDNGSGKSSLLEAIFILGHGKSFRTLKSANISHFDSGKFIVSVKDYESNQLGIEKDTINSITTIRVNGSNLQKLSELAKFLAVQIVTPESFKLFFGGPKERRKFVDLGLFHVEHSFSNVWPLFSKVLKHRNACLKSGKNIETIGYWNEQFCLYSKEISGLREHYIDKFSAELLVWLDILLPQISGNIKLVYSKGWKKGTELAEVLASNYLKEQQFGHTLFGPHKFDIKFVLDGQPLESVISRGQQKLFLLALTIAQAKLIEKVKRVKPILLIDDVGAELDVNSRAKLTEAMKLLDCQIIITAIDEAAILPLIPEDNSYHMFHVEHGKVTPM